MDNMSKERMDELADVKELVKKKNVDAVAQLLLDSRQHNYKVQQEIGELRQAVTTCLAEISQLRGELSMTRAQLFAFMGNGEMGN